MVAKFMFEKFMVEKIMVHGWNIQCQKIHEVGKFHMALVLKIPELKLGTENSSFLYKIAEEKMRAESLIYKCFQVTLPTLPCNQLPYLQSTSVGEKSAFPRLANLLVSRHVYTSAIRKTVHSAFWPVKIHDEWKYEVCIDLNLTVWKKNCLENEIYLFAVQTLFFSHLSNIFFFYFFWWYDRNMYHIFVLPIIRKKDILDIMCYQKVGE